MFMKTHGITQSPEQESRSAYVYNLSHVGGWEDL